MKVYLALKHSVTLMDGTDTDYIGIYSTYENAKIALDKTEDLKEYKYDPQAQIWLKIFDGELHFALKIIETEVDKEL